MPIPDDYGARVYAGVLGKITGVYLGRPFEGWRWCETSSPRRRTASRFSPYRTPLCPGAQLR